LGIGVWELQEERVAGRIGEGMEIAEKIPLERKGDYDVGEEWAGRTLAGGM
jgi:hypothetical protein